MVDWTVPLKLEVVLVALVVTVAAISPAAAGVLLLAAAPILVIAISALYQDATEVTASPLDWSPQWWAYALLGVGLSNVLFVLPPDVVTPSWLGGVPGAFEFGFAVAFMLYLWQRRMAEQRAARGV